MTGSELVRGDRQDANGPFLAREAVSLGLEPSRITVVGDTPDALERALRDGLEADLCVVSGGLGPTHDDRTVEAVARVSGRKLVVDAALEAEIGAFSRGIAERLQRPYADFETGVRKQATIPEGAHVIGLAGTAPGLVVEAGAVVVVLPGPPVELRRLWRAALETDRVREVLARARPPDRRVLRFFGVSESAVARALEEAGGEGADVEATICAREFEIHVDLVSEPGSPHAAELEQALADRLEQYLFGRDERSIEELVLDLCRARGYSIATAESCTGGLVATRLTRIPGASDVVRGAIVAYDDAVKQEQLGVPAEMLARLGAVSAEVAQAMAQGARARLGADVTIAITGVAGPGGGTPEKPVGRVHIAVAAPAAAESVELTIPGDRDAVRARSATTALHLVRRVLAQSRDESV